MSEIVYEKTAIDYRGNEKFWRVRKEANEFVIQYRASLYEKWQYQTKTRYSDDVAIYKTLRSAIVSVNRKCKADNDLFELRKAKTTVVL